MRAITKYLHRVGALAAAVSVLAFACVPTAAVAVSKQEGAAAQAYAAGGGITKTRARRVIRWNASRVCHSVEHEIKIKVKVKTDPLLPPKTITKTVQNGTCLDAAVGYGTCDEGKWKKGGSGVDISMEGQKYFHCKMVIKWRPNRYTKDGVCWEEVGKPKDTNAIIKPSRFMEVGYDKRGALRTHVDDWTCGST